ncbi:hypothetical protein ACIA6C_14210 [Streptomyces sp. NPDC051578]|uniref:hypothetical protein n=1 Tax=Streptomyces sp. NPDC051578 TaxID=3365662 RepID=UPI003797ACE0
MPAALREDHKMVGHPSVDPVPVDRDILADGDCELEVVIITVVPVSGDETQLRLTTVAGRVPRARHRPDADPGRGLDQW